MSVKLGRKTLLYSLALGVLVAALLVVHMVVLLPALYVDYQETKDQEAVKAIHMAALQDEDLAKRKMERQSGAIISVRIPRDADTITFFSLFSGGTVRIRDEEIRGLFSKYKEKLLTAAEDDAMLEQLKETVTWDKKKKTIRIKDATLRQDVETIRDYFLRIQEQMAKSAGLETDIQWKSYESIDGEMKYQQLGEHTIMLETGVTDTSRKAEYRSYFLCSIREDGIYMTAATGVIPRIGDILPVTLQNLPMIVTVLFVIVLAGSLLFSRRLVEPVIRIQRYASEAKKEQEGLLSPPVVRGKDELAKLAENVRDLYETKQRQYQKLSEISRRREVFLRASSHRLKTPVAAALLLVDGMIQKVGKYADQETYLPKVKEQLQSMQRMIEEVLYMNNAEQNPVLTLVPVRALLDNMVEKTTVQCGEKQLDVEIKGEAVWETDEDMLGHMLDNLLGNAIQYTESGGKIRIMISQERIRMENEPAHIEESLLPVVKDPFVSGNVNSHAHGLGLYLTDFYAGMLGMDCKVENTEQGVAVVLQREKEERKYAEV